MKPVIGSVLSFLLMACSIAPAAGAATLEPATSRAWDEYINDVSARMQNRVRPGNSFLWADETPGRLAKVRAGEIVVSPAGPDIPKRVSSGLIHHWVGAVFIPNVTVDDLLRVVRDYGNYRVLYQPTVVESKTIAAGQSNDRFSLLLAYKSAFLKAALQTDFESNYVRIDDHRLYSVTRTTAIREIADYGTGSQHALGNGEGSGLIWRLYSTARYLERDGGVYYEVEAVGLSRDIPPSFRWIANSIVRRVSKASLSASLRCTESATQTLAASTGSRSHAPITASNRRLAHAQILPR